MPPPEPYYQDDNCTIYHGDCAEILPLLGKVDAIVTDPPYGIGESSKKNASRAKPFGSSTALGGAHIKPKDYDTFNWDDRRPSGAVINRIQNSSQFQIIFGGNYFNLPPTSCYLIWDKDNSGDFADCELAWTNLKKAVRMLTYRWNGCLQETSGGAKENRVHPTQKPIKVMEWCITHLPIKTGLIVDPFMGSGTTLIAARNLGFKSIGIDQDQRYCEIAKKRLTGEIGLTVQEQKQVDARAAGQMNLLDLIGGS